MADRKPRRWRVPVLLALLAATGCTAAPNPAPGPTAPSDAPVTAGPGLAANPDPARYAAQVRTHATAAGINPVLLMAILYNENYKPHDPQLERAWQKLNPDAAFGIANMHEAAFEDTRKGRPFAGRSWQDLPDDPDLAIQAAAWYLHDLAAQLPKNPPAGYTRDELLALGYNAGPGTMKAVARGTKPTGQSQSYVDQTRTNWPTADSAIRHG
jgi:hypothetical protein